VERSQFRTWKRQWHAPCRLAEIKEREHLEKIEIIKECSDENRMGQPNPLLCFHAYTLAKTTGQAYENGNINAVWMEISTAL
jgi:hypothetical protein